MTNPVKELSATRSVAIAFGLLASTTGILYGLFEIAQGNVPVENFRISAIGPEYSMWANSTYASYTLIPNFLFTGITTLITSSLVSIWVVFFIHRKYGSMIMVLLSLIQFLTGGGIAVDVAILSAIIATQVNKPLLWWKKITSAKLRQASARLWPWVFILFLVLAIGMLVLTVLGLNRAAFHQIITYLAAALFFPVIFSVLCGFSFDLMKHDQE